MKVTPIKTTRTEEVLESVTLELSQSEFALLTTAMLLVRDQVYKPVRSSYGKMPEELAHSSRLSSLASKLDCAYDDAVNRITYNTERGEFALEHEDVVNDV